MKEITYKPEDIKEVNVKYGETIDEYESHITIILKNNKVIRYVPFFNSFAILSGEEIIDTI